MTLNRLPFNISGLPEGDHHDFLAYLQSDPKFRDIKMQMHLNSADGGQTPQPGAISASISLSYLDKTFRYKDYLVTVQAVLGEVYITCEKVTQESLFRMYDEARQAVRNLAKKEAELEIEFKKRMLYERLSMYRELKEKFKENKRQIKNKLIELGIEIKPGSELSKLLRTDNPTA